MSYQVIARKYRPQRFSDVVGQEHVTQTLSNAIAQNRIAHAYLFCGPRGTGKTTVARIFAKCLNCTGGPNVNFEDSDPRCQEITEGRSLDVLEIDGASNNGVEQVRELRDTVKFAPAGSRFKIFIIDEVHMLSTAAFNALLKTLEEPPAHVKFMFATTDPEKVLPTILSRCQRFDLRRIPVALIVKHLAHIATLEKVSIDESALHAVARGADGGMRDAESALDQLISFCGQTIEESDVLSMYGLTSRTQVLAIAVAILQGDAAAVLRELDALSRHGKDLNRLLADLLGHFRNLLVYQVSQGDLSLLEVSESEAASLQSHGSLIATDALTRVLEVLTESEGRMRDAASKKIFLEVALFKAIQARNAVSLDAVLSQLKQLRSGNASGPSTGLSAPEPVASKPAVSATVPAPSPAPVSASAPTPQVSSVAGGPSRPAAPAAPAAAPASSPKSGTSGRPASLAPSSVDSKPVYSLGASTSSGAAGPTPAATLDIQTFNALWPQLLEGVGRVSPFTRSYLLEAFPVGCVGSVVSIGFDEEFVDHIELVNNSKNIELLQTKLKELGHPGLYVKFVKAPMPANWAKPVIPASTAAAPASAPASPAGAVGETSRVASTPASGAAAPSQTPANGSAEAARSAPPPAAPVTLNAADFKNDPLIQKALEMFRGRIVEVRS